MGLLKLSPILEHKVKKVYAFWNNDEFGIFYPSKEELFYDRESAIKKAEEMRQKKIESLKKQIKKLKEMRFEG